MEHVRKLRDGAETVLRGKFLVQMLTLEKKSQIRNLSFHLKLEKKKQCKPKSCRKEERNVVFIVQSLSCVLLFAKPWSAAQQAPLASVVSWSLHVPVHWAGDAVTISPLPLPSPPALNLSQHQGPFSGWLEYWSFSFCQQLQWIFRVNFF